MKSLEEIEINGKTVALVVRAKFSVKKGIHFFSEPKDPLQLALHEYKIKKTTHTHDNKIKKPIVLNSKQKYLYMIKGSAVMELSDNHGRMKSVNLKRGDSVIIMDVLHRIIFSKGSRALEIKQGPYEEN